MTYSVSIVVPVFNEEEAVKNVDAMLRAALHGQFESFEVIYVNDASTDDTRICLDNLKDKDSTIKVIHLVENRGQSNALLEGVKEAQFEIIVMMDGDEQYDPKDIPKLCILLQGNIRLVSGSRDNRKDSFLYRSFSFVGNTMIALMFGMEKFDLGCGLKVAYKKDLLAMPYFKYVHRYFQIIYFNSFLGIAQMEINHKPRLTGKSKYSIWKVLNIIPRLFWLKIYKPRLKYVFK